MSQDKLLEVTLSAHASSQIDLVPKHEELADEEKPCCSSTVCYGASYMLSISIRLTLPFCRRSGTAQSKSKSQRHAVATNHCHLPTYSTVDGGRRTLSYTALTPQALQQHDIHQASWLRDVELEYIQVDQVGRIGSAFDSLGFHLDHVMHAKLYHDPIGMAPMKRFQASPTSATEVNTYNALPPPVNGKIIAQSPSQEYTYGASSIIANAGGEAIDRDCYVQNSAPDAIVFAPERQYRISGSAYAHGVTHRDNVLDGFGAQFDSYLYSDYATSPYVVEDDALEE